MLAIIVIYESKTDKNGNRYFAFTYRDVLSGESVNAMTTGGENNIEIAMRQRFDLNHSLYHIERKTLPIRAFDRMVKPWKHAGCLPNHINEFIDKELKK